jgi:hypothetical protein
MSVEHQICCCWKNPEPLNPLSPLQERKGGVWSHGGSAGNGMSPDAPPCVMEQQPPSFPVLPLSFMYCLDSLQLLLS